MLSTLRELKEHAAAARPALAAALRDNRQQRWQILTAIEQIGPDEATIEVLLDLLRHGDLSTMTRAAQILDVLGEPASGAFDILLPQMRDPLRRYNAVMAMGQLSSQAQRVVPILEKALQSNDGELISAGLEAARLIGEPAEALLPSMKALLRNDDFRVSSINALGSLGPAGGETVTVLRAGLKHPDENVRNASIRALGALGPAAEPAVPELVALLDDSDLTYAIVSALGNIGQAAEPAVEKVIALLDEPQHRMAAANTLRDLESVDALPKLKQVEQQTFGWQRQSIRRAIEALEEASKAGG